MCVNFTNLNKTCPKDSYPLPTIDSLVDKPSGYQLLSFLDAFSRNNEIRMHIRDERKTSFMVEYEATVTRSCPLALRMLAQPTRGC